MALTLGNPLGGVAAGAVNENQFKISSAGRSLSTGIKANNDIVSEFLGKSLSDKFRILDKINNNMGYSKNAMLVASSSLDSIAKTLVDMLTIVAQATSDTNLDTLNEMLQGKLRQVELQTNSATFDNRKLLKGALGQDSTVRTEYENKAVSIKTMPATAATTFLGTGTSSAAVQGHWTLTAATVVAGDTVTLNGLVFVGLANGTPRTTGSLAFEVGAGGTADADSATNLAAAINDIKVNGTAAQKLALANYTVTSSAAVVDVYQVTPETKAVANVLVGSGATVTAAPVFDGVIATGPNVQSTITVGTVVAGDSIVIEGVTFKAVAGDPIHDNDFTIGVSSAATTGNLAKAIQQSKSESLQAFTSSVAANKITLTRVSQGTNAITIINKTASVFGVASTAGSGSGIDLSGIKTLDGFIGVSAKPIFAFEHQETGLGAQAQAKAAGNDLASTPGVAAAAGDSVAIYSTTIGGRKFTGAIYEANGATNLNNAQIKMIEESTGEFFTVTAAAGYTGRVNTQAAAGSAGATTGVAGDLNTLFATTNFNETRTLKINTDKGDILVNNTPIASTKGASVKLTATDFTNLQFKDFKIEPGAAVGNVKFTAIITDKDGYDQSYTNDIAAAAIPLMTQGYKLDLTDSTGGTGNVLSINLGERGLVSLNLAANFAAVSEAYKDMLLSTGDGLEVKVGLNFEDVIKTSIKDISASKLYVNDNGLYVAQLDIATDSGRKIAQEVITNALEKVRSEQSRVSSQIESIQEASESLSRNIQVTKEASDGYLNTDLIQSAQEFSEAVKRTIAAISTLEAGNKVSDAAQRVIQSIA